VVTLFVNVDTSLQTWEIRARTSHNDNGGLQSFSIRPIATGNLVITSKKRAAPGGYFPATSGLPPQFNFWGFDPTGQFFYHGLYDRFVQLNQIHDLKQTQPHLGQLPGSRTGLIDGVETLVTWDADVKLMEGTYSGTIGSIGIEREADSWFNLLDGSINGASSRIIQGPYGDLSSVSVFPSSTIMAPETLPNSGAAAVQVIEAQVPEPGMLAIAGVALAIFARRKRTSTPDRSL
jgi:hypothetical protein